MGKIFRIFCGALLAVFLASTPSGVLLALDAPPGSEDIEEAEMEYTRKSRARPLLYKPGEKDLKRKLGKKNEVLENKLEKLDVYWDGKSDKPHIIQGAGISIDLSVESDPMSSGDSASSSGKEQLRQAGNRLKDLLREYESILGVENIELRLDVEGSSYFPLKDYWSFKFQQYHDDVPVERAYVYFRINNNKVIQFGTNRVAEIGLDATPSVSADDAFQGALDELLIGEIETGIVSYGILKIVPYQEDNVSTDEYHHLLVWEYVFELAEDSHVYALEVDAHSGQIVFFEDNTLYSDARVYGYVELFDHGGPMVSVNLPYATVWNNGEKTTDELGVYDYSGGTATCELTGPYAEIEDLCGTISLSDSTDGDLNFGVKYVTNCSSNHSGGAGNSNAARTTFYHLNRINREAAEYYPDNTWLGQPLTAVTNVDDTCNAIWTGAQISLYHAGDGCSNTGEIAEIIYHEWGHGFDTSTGGVTDEKGTREAFADTTSFLESLTGCLADDFKPGVACYNCRTSCDGIRDLEAFAIGGVSTIASPGNIEDDDGINCDRFTKCPYYMDPYLPPPYGPNYYKGPMGYEGHCESYIASTANWDLARMLVAVHGEDEGWRIMKDLWYASVPVAGEAYRVASGGQCNPSAEVDGCEAENWYTVYLSIDDDDGNISNGTPNGCLIWDAFNAHGIACGDRPVCYSALASQLIGAVYLPTLL